VAPAAKRAWTERNMIIAVYLLMRWIGVIKF
jgi:hypothetical protein